ncbi:vacuolar segregation protein (Pep7), putative [Talaromyces stipitatus ATCC 10500]|uniref:Vacuolar segregation protein (Pep7), putative n=1 Tax=Talaromyces stipitatus (strain ATCC 10500 / CBS 375.48 / QM 6759 / NRRL 1006) TaxID=441959 RepID=B8M595_TALSN|nr:vacuolar segregation protein (Pep7), putative [Talaromyces stipitatus ATCC 10500]EED19701.1 vacuolar segregation protein (Pep7), putative [Talaromyces stipitatus ATCC 10500]
MARRVLGGGRVLGSGKNLSPATASSTSSPQPKGRQSPSPSSVSLNSQASASQYAPDLQDLTSRISHYNGETSISAAPATTGAQLACPICNEEMVTLLQLNRHLDDAHQNLEEVRQDEVKDWFKAQMDKAKRFQPLAVLNQKLKGLDVFESNENAQPPSIAITRQVTGPVEVNLPDPDEVITREHWQPRGLYDVCCEPSCGKRLTSTTGCVNCRKCGELYCEEHTMYQMKLSRSAQHEPIRGLWCRVCETCYKSREGYNDHNGLIRDHTEQFSQLRRPTIDKAALEVSRLEKRLTRLTQALASLPVDQIQSGASKRWPLGRQGDQRREIEQSIVSWQDDASVPQCPFCQQEFTSYTFRRHHCRTCGRVVCADQSTACSVEVGLAVLSQRQSPSEKAVPSKINVDIRLCKECRATLFSRRDFDEERNQKPPVVRSYDNLIQFERGIRLLQPRFQKLLSALQDPHNPPIPEQLTEASKVRKRLIDSFAQYDTAARRIRDLPTDSPTQQKLQKAIYQQASNFLHLHMLPLKSLPKILKHATPGGRPTLGGHSRNSLTTESSTTKPFTPALASIKYGLNTPNGSSQSITSDNSSAISALEDEEKALRDRLIVLEEQKFFVSEMIADANRRRKFDEVSTLALNMEDLSKEIDRINGILNKLDFESLYTGNAQG